MTSILVPGVSLECADCHTRSPLAFGRTPEEAAAEVERLARVAGRQGEECPRCRGLEPPAGIVETMERAFGRRG